MTEQLTNDAETVSRVSLATLQEGDHLEITTGADNERWKYLFDVVQAGDWPHGTLAAVKPDGTFLEPVDFILQGAGIWTDRRQNPVQKIDRGFTSYFDSLYIGGNMVGSSPADTERVIFDAPGQVISNITLHTHTKAA